MDMGSKFISSTSILDKLNRIILLIMMVCILTGCAASWKPVATLDEFAVKAEVEKSRNWQKQTQARAGVCGVLGGSIVLLPIGLLYCSAWSEKGMTIPEIAQAAAYQTYDQSNLFGQHYVAYTDGRISMDFWIAGRRGDIEDNTQVIGITYLNQNEDRVYYEAWLVKNQDGKYYEYHMPVLQRIGQDLVYTFDKAKKIIKAKNAKGGMGTRFAMEIEVEENGNKLTIDFRDISKDFREYINEIGPELIYMNCLNAHSCHPEPDMKRPEFHDTTVEKLNSN